MRYAAANARSPNSNIVIAGTTAGTGVIELANNNLAIALGTGAGQLQFTNTGGFRSVGGNRTVTLNGGAGLTWGSGNFVPGANAFYLATDGASSLNFVNPIDLGASARTIQLGAGTGALHAVMSGVLSGAGGGLTLARQSGNGVLELSAANTYTGTTRVGSLVNLILNNANALPGGVGATGGTSNLALDGGVVLLRPTAGDFFRGTGSGANQVQWITGGGFAALGGDRTINLGGAGGTVTWNTANFVPTGSQLTLGSTLADSMLTFENPIALGGATRNIFIDNGSAALDATLPGAISGTGDLLLDGTGDVRLSGTNSFTGTAFLGANAGATSSDTQDVFVSTIGNSGVNGNLGAGSTIALRSHNGSLTYTGAGESTDRAWTIGGRNGATLSLLNAGTGALVLGGAWTKDAAGAITTLRFGGTYTGGTNIVDGLISESSGTLNLVFNGTGNDWRLTADNTYSGTTSIQGSTVLEVDHLANGGVASSIGDSSNAATNLVFQNGTAAHRRPCATSAPAIRPIATSARRGRRRDLRHRRQRYRRAGVDRQPRRQRQFPEPSDAAWHEHARQHLRRHVHRQQCRQRVGRRRHQGGCGHVDPVGQQQRAGARLRGQHHRQRWLVAHRFGGRRHRRFGTASNHGASGSAQRSSLVAFGNTAAGASVNGGVLGLTAGSGDFLRNLTTASTAFLSNAGTAGNADDDTYVHGVRWFGSGGFAAFGGTRTVNLGGAGAGVTWNTGGFVGIGQRLILGDASADGTLVFANAIALGGATRGFEARDGSADIDGVLSGALTGAGSVQKSGDGTLRSTARRTS